MQHFLEINQLSSNDIYHLVNRALFFKNTREYPTFKEARLANLFYENSTRTRISFELAAHHLSIPVVNFSEASSSEKKGELLDDTVKTLAAMDINLFVIRHRENGQPQALAKVLDATGAHVINAGDGTHAHPSQALLDAMTILEMKKSLQGLKIAIVGNIRHSRVANSLQSLFSIAGFEGLYLVAPEIWLPRENFYGKLTTSLHEGLENADVIICLRVQRERLAEADQIDLDSYHRDYGLTPKSLAWAKNDAMIMHPGPVNRGIEIDSELVNGRQSYILQQVSNGVFMRMAMIEFILGFARPA
jgi:aspartate carbamoyltransferase catalytic subunit